MIGGTKHSKVTDFHDVLLVLKTLLTHKVNQWQKGRFIGGGEHNAVEVKEALDLFALGEQCFRIRNKTTLVNSSVR